MSFSSSNVHPLGFEDYGEYRKTYCGNRHLVTDGSTMGNPSGLQCEYLSPGNMERGKTLYDREGGMVRIKLTAIGPKGTKFSGWKSEKEYWEYTESLWFAKYGIHTFVPESVSSDTCPCKSNPCTIDSSSITVDQEIKGISCIAEFQPIGSSFKYKLQVLVPREGDYNDDSLLTGEDLDMISSSIRSGNYVQAFDFNHDNKLDLTDRDIWIREYGQTTYGDSNMDQRFDSQDIVAAFQAGFYEDSSKDDVTWAEGDWDGDGKFTSSDLVAAFSTGVYSE